MSPQNFIKKAFITNPVLSVLISVVIILVGVLCYIELMDIANGIGVKIGKFWAK